MHSAALLVLTVCAWPEPALEKAWYSPHELLPALAARDGIRWAMPETLAGRAWVGGSGSHKAILDDACKQWGLAWIESNGVVVVHRAEDARLRELSAIRNPEALWELGWLRDARAVPVLAEALAGRESTLALAAAQALDVLLTDIPLGREERVDPPLPGRVSLAAAFPPTRDLLPLLDSPYPPVRAAALRLLLGAGGKSREDALAKTARDAALAVVNVRQQHLFTPRADKPPRPREPIPPAPADPAELKATCAKIVEDLPALEKRSAWEIMTHHADTLSAWSRAGRDVASDTLGELTATKVQPGWYPGYVQKCLASSGSERVRAKIKEILPRAALPFLVRGLEESTSGVDLVALTGPYLADQTVCYVTTRKAGREAVTLLLPLAEKGNTAAIDALGVIGGPRVLPTLRRALETAETQSATGCFRAAKALARVGTAEALHALLGAAEDKSPLRRQAAVLFAGRIGGPRALAALTEIVAKDPSRLVRAAAADALEQIGTPEALSLVATFRKADAGPPPLEYRPRNARFGPDFPVNEWVNLKITVQAQGWGEIGWNHDPANHLFFRYGGCTGPYNNELTIFDLGTEQFQQRRSIELMAGWGDCRPGNGCSVGRTWDPILKSAWIRHGIGGTGNQLGMVEYQSRSPAARFCSYDLATDRFRPAAYREAIYGEPATRLVCDWERGLLYPIKFQHPNHKTKDFWALDLTADNPLGEAAWRDLKDPDGPYPWQPHAHYTTAAVDQDAHLLVVYVPAFDTRSAQTWVYDPDKKIWKDMQPKVQPEGVVGGGLVYDPFHKVLLYQSGRKATQFGGAEDSITWSYDVRSNTWTDLKATNGPGNPWVGAMDFDPEHNVAVLFSFRDKQVWAYRHKAVAVGTKAK
jgi:HEAT repeat protein